MRKVLAIGLMAFLFVGCNRQQLVEDDLLWGYYDTFSYPPEKMIGLLKKATKDDLRLFIKGLMYLEQCDFDTNHNPKYLDSAGACFDSLKNNRPTDYKGYLGLGLTYTEYPDRDARFKDTTQYRQPKRDSLFNIAFQNYRKAHQLRPDLVAIDYYWARALFYRQENDFSLPAIRKLDSVIQKRPNFFKAHERAAQFLSHYKTISLSGNPENKKIKKIIDTLRYHLPDLTERVRYHFDQSLNGDSTWYETYEGIANAKGIYAIYERVQYLEKAIRIARQKKSLDTTKLIAMRWSIFAEELSNNDTVLAESEQKKTNGASELSSISQAYYYLKNYRGHQRTDSIIQVTKKQIGYRKPDFWVAMAESKRADTVYQFFAKDFAKEAPNLQAKFILELSKWYWIHHRSTDALKVLNEIKDHKKLEEEVDDRLHYWSDFLENWTQSGSESKVSKF